MDSGLLVLFRTLRAVQRFAVAASLLAGALPSPLPGQASPPAEIPRVAARESWNVRSIADFDLWFHGMAVIGFEGFGPLRMYDGDYAERVRAAKRRRGIYPTLLDRKSARFRAAFYSDSTFEIMHFLPLYFLAPGSGGLLRTIRSIGLEGSAGDNAGDPTTRDAVKAIGSVLASRRQRELLGEFVDVLEDERRVFYEDYERESNGARTTQIAKVQQHWNADLAPALAPYLERWRLGNGLIVVSPPLGAEGRFVILGRGSSPGPVIAVGLPSSPADRDAVAISAVRELCFPIVHAVIGQDAARKLERVAAERLSSVAAVRCGALALERYVPALRSSYQSRFLRAAGSPATGADIDAAFIRVFNLPPAVDAGLRRAIFPL